MLKASVREGTRQVLARMELLLKLLDSWIDSKAAEPSHGVERSTGVQEQQTANSKYRSQQDKQVPMPAVKKATSTAGNRAQAELQGQAWSPLLFLDLDTRYQMIGWYEAKPLQS